MYRVYKVETPGDFLNIYGLTQKSQKEDRWFRILELCLPYSELKKGLFGYFYKIKSKSFGCA